MLVWLKILPAWHAVTWLIRMTFWRFGNVKYAVECTVTAALMKKDCVSSVPTEIIQGQVVVNLPLFYNTRKSFDPGQISMTLPLEVASWLPLTPHYFKSRLNLHLMAKISRPGFLLYLKSVV